MSYILLRESAYTCRGEWPVAFKLRPSSVAAGWKKAMSKAILEPAIPDAAAAVAADITWVRRQEALLETGALQSAIFNSANFSSIATDAKGVIQIFNVGAERMLGYTAAEVMNKIT